jgi:hypothetical protein
MLVDMEVCNRHSRLLYARAHNLSETYQDVVAWRKR